MRRAPHRGIVQAALAVAVVAGMTGLAALAPAAAQEPADPVTLAASGLYNPRGLAWDADGVLHVAQAGTGVTETAVGAAASVVEIEGGCPVPVAAGLPSTRGMSGAVQGAGAVAYLDGTLYVLQDSQDDRGDLKATFPNGVYAVTAQGGVRRVADVSAWMDANPTRTIPHDRGKLGETFAMMAGDGFLWVVESNEGQVLKVTPDGAITRVADLSNGHPVPTGIAPARDGGVFVGNLTDTPYPDGTAKVVHVSPAGEVSTVWTGLTMVTALATGRDGTLYALEMSTGNGAASPYVRPYSGRIVKQIAPDSLREVVTGLNFPIAMAVGPDDALYVSMPALGSDGPAGSVVRVDPRSEFLSVPDNVFADADCPGFREAQQAMAAQLAQMTAAESVPVATPEATAPANAVHVEIKNFAFDPPTLTTKAGTTVTWTNRDVVPHTATSTSGEKAFDSGNLNQGQSFSFTFMKPGTYPYQCTYHPYMKGTIVVE